MDITGRLAGKVALVTGGSRGIGAEIVRRLAAEGADVAFTYLTGKNEAEQVAGGCAAWAGGRSCSRPTWATRRRPPRWCVKPWARSGL
jgi:3-oxoacyl-[acyl-carrier protein] reductase